MLIRMRYVSVQSNIKCVKHQPNKIEQLGAALKRIRFRVPKQISLLSWFRGLTREIGKWNCWNIKAQGEINFQVLKIKKSCSSYLVHLFVYENLHYSNTVHTPYWGNPTLASYPYKICSQHCLKKMQTNTRNKPYNFVVNIVQIKLQVNARNFAELTITK